MNWQMSKGCKVREDNAEPKIKDQLQHAMISLGIPTAMNYIHHRNSLKAFIIG
jgi:hypothetical protein